MSFNNIVWSKYDKSSVIACTEKIKVMTENLLEIQQMMQDAYEDAILMEIDPDQVLEQLHALVQSLHNPYKDNL